MTLRAIKLWVKDEPWRRGVQIVGVVKLPGVLPQKYAMVDNMTCHDAAEGEELVPIAEMEHADVVALLDQLWGLGYRPSDYAGPGELEATRAHLRDMRAIVSAGWDVDLDKAKGGGR
jgi:hypothetical protein